MNIEMNLLSDWQDIIINKMVREGLQFSRDINKSLLIIRYFTYLRKKGGQISTPRRIHISKEFVCPTELKTGFDKIVDVLRTGQDISPYLSTQVDKITKFDEMFNDWGVLHLHLGDRPYPRDARYIERTGSLLFLYLMPQDAYLINIYEHGDWTDKSILQIVQDNWPELIAPYIMKGAKSLSHQYTEREHAELRKAGVCILMELKDHNGDTFVIAPPGLGMTTSKDPVQDVRRHDEDATAIQNIERHIRDNPKCIEKAFNGKAPETVILKLIYQSNNWSIVEQTTSTIIEL